MFPSSIVTECCSVNHPVINFGIYPLGFRSDADQLIHNLENIGFINNSLDAIMHIISDSKNIEEWWNHVTNDQCYKKFRTEQCEFTDNDHV